jgi:hypothetical protein
MDSVRASKGETLDERRMVQGGGAGDEPGEFGIFCEEVRDGVLGGIGKLAGWAGAAGHEGMIQTQGVTGCVGYDVKVPGWSSCSAQREPLSGELRRTSDRGDWFRRDLKGNEQADKEKGRQRDSLELSGEAEAVQDEFRLGR